MHRRILFPGISILVGFVIAIVILEVVFRMLPVCEGVNLLPVNEQNPVPRFAENRDFTWSDDWKFSIISKKHSNNYGFLNDNDYHKEENTPLMAIIGDSYVEAPQLDNRSTVHGILSEKVPNKGRIYSFAMSRAPMSTYLAYAEYTRNEFSPNSMVFVIVGNDFDQSLSKYEMSPGFYYFFVDDDQKLVLKRIDYYKPFSRRLFRKSALMRYIFFNLKLDWPNVKEKIFFRNDLRQYVGNTSSEASEERVSDSKKVVDEFLLQLPLRSGLDATHIMFIVDGMRPHIYSDHGLQDANGSYFDIMRKYFIFSARSKGYEVIDMQPIFIMKNRADGSRFEFETDAHWNALGHKIVADTIESSSVYLGTFGR